MAEQLAFDLQFRPALGRGDFFVAPCNEAAVGLIDRWPQWCGPTLCLFGPAGSGKSHLAHVFAAKAKAQVLEPEDLRTCDPLSFFNKPASAVVLEGADRLLRSDRQFEEALFHLLNAATQRGGWMLLTAQQAPPRWAVSLADLRSRLNALPSAGLEEPDDALLSAVILKQFSDRGLDVAPGAISYLMARIERRFAAVKGIIDQADRAALQEGRAVTIAVLKQVLDQKPSEGR